MTNDLAIRILNGDILGTTEQTHEAVAMAVKALSAEEESFEWCIDCREYDQEAHCCHRWTKVIRNTVEEIRNEMR